LLLSLAYKLSDKAKRRDVVADNFYGGGSTMVAKTPVTKLTTVFMARYFGI
jgi:hypothetical protein